MTKSCVISITKFRSLHFYWKKKQNGKLKEIFIYECYGIGIKGKYFWILKHMVMDQQYNRCDELLGGPIKLGTQTTENGKKSSFKIKTQTGNFLKKGSLNYFSKQQSRFLLIFTYQKVQPDIQIFSLPKERSQDCRAA